MTDRELMQMALDALIDTLYNGYFDPETRQKINGIAQALRDRLAQPEPEPVSHRYFREIYEVWAGSEGIPLPKTCTEGYLLHLIEQMRDIAKEGLKHTAPSKREWVGLTDEEIEDGWQYLMAKYIEEVDSSYWSRCDFEFARVIESKLKEKNT